jgi:hypothetical protein
MAASWCTTPFRRSGFASPPIRVEFHGQRVAGSDIGGVLARSYGIPVSADRFETKVGDTKDQKDPKEQKGHKDHKEPKDAKDHKEGLLEKPPK